MATHSGPSSSRLLPASSARLHNYLEMLHSLRREVHREIHNGVVEDELLRSQRARAKTPPLSPAVPSSSRQGVANGWQQGLSTSAANASSTAAAADGTGLASGDALETSTTSIAAYARQLRRVGSIVDAAPPPPQPSYVSFSNSKTHTATTTTMPPSAATQPGLHLPEASTFEKSRSASFLLPSASGRQVASSVDSHNNSSSTITKHPSVLVRITLPFLVDGAASLTTAPAFVLTLSDFEQSGPAFARYVLQQTKLRFPHAAERLRSHRGFVLYAAGRDDASCTGASQESTPHCGAVLLHPDVPLRRYAVVADAIHGGGGDGDAGIVAGAMRRTLLASRSLQPVTAASRPPDPVLGASEEIHRSLFDLEVFLFPKDAIDRNDPRAQQSAVLVAAG